MDALTSPGETSKEDGRLQALRCLEEGVVRCQRCRLAQGRTHAVPGGGNPNARVLFVGEAPGAEEDRLGRPFVGRSGQYLTEVLARCGVARSDVYITNIVKCRPPGNRTPEPDEIKSCFPFLLKQIQIIQPRVICALGTVSAQTLLQTDTKITSLRGKSFEFSGIKVFPTYHPAFLLRNPDKKREVWEDIQKIAKALREGKG